MMIAVAVMLFDPKCGAPLVLLCDMCNRVLCLFVASVLFERYIGRFALVEVSQYMIIVCMTGRQAAYVARIISVAFEHFAIVFIFF